jgi:uncharacterized membrane protein (UPF0182 family)
LTLWNQQGSNVIRGNLLVLPLDDVLLFAEPMYLQAERSPMPELRLVVLATQDHLAYASRFSDALNSLLQGRTGTVEPSPVPATTTSTTTLTAVSRPPGQAALERANQALLEYQRLTAEGKLGEAGAKLEELKRILQTAVPGQTPRQ